MADDSWETEIQQQARLEFISTWKDHFPPDRLAGLSMVWANTKFLGCRYPTAVQNLVRDLESKAPISVDLSKLEKSKKITFKPAQIIQNLVIYEPYDDSDALNAISVLYESTQKSKKTILFDEQPLSKSGLYSFAVLIENKLIAIGEAINKKDAKRIAADNALKVLKPCQTVIKKRKIDHEAAQTVTKTELTKKAYVEAPSIPESNLGNQLLRKMGWTGVGGVGKECQGRAEPVLVTGVDGKRGLGQGSVTKDLHQDSVRQVLMDFINGPEPDMKFSAELEKEDRALVHRICQQFGLRHQSHGKGEDRYLVVSKVQ